MTNRKELDKENSEMTKEATEISTDTETHSISENSNSNKLLTPEEYMSTLKRFRQFNDFFALVLRYLPYPKTSIVQSLITKINNANNEEPDTSFAYELTYSELMTLKKLSLSIISLLKAGGFRPSRKVTGAIYDDLNDLEVHLILRGSDDNSTVNDDVNTSPFSSWL